MTNMLREKEQHVRRLHVDPKKISCTQQCRLRKQCKERHQGFSDPSAKLHEDKCTSIGYYDGGKS